MSNPTIELSKDQVINALVQFPPKELKEIIDTLLKQKAFVPPSLEEITEEASKIIQREGLDPEIVYEARKWARSEK